MEQNTTDEGNANVKAYYKLMDETAKYEAERKLKSRNKARALRLLKRLANMAEKMKQLENDFDKLFFDDGVFGYFERMKWRTKHKELFEKFEAVIK